MPAPISITEAVPAPTCDDVPCAAPALVGESTAVGGPGRSIRGRLTDASGAPLGNARLTLVHALWDPPYQREPPFRFPPPGVRPHLVTTTVDVTGTDPRGEFLLREPSEAEQDTRFVVVEHGGRGRTVQLGDESVLEVVLPEVAAVTVRALVASPRPATTAYVWVYWTGPSGAEAWSMNPLVPPGGAEVVTTVGLPRWEGAALFESTSPSTLERRIEVPVGDVRITVYVEGTRANHRQLLVPARGLDGQVLDLSVPHPDGARLTLELSHVMSPAVLHRLFLWQFPEIRYYASLSGHARNRPVFEDLPPGRYFIGTSTHARPECRRSILLGPNEDRVLQVDGRTCVVGIQMPYD